MCVDMSFFTVEGQAGFALADKILRAVKADLNPDKQVCIP